MCNEEENISDAELYGHNVLQSTSNRVKGEIKEDMKKERVPWYQKPVSKKRQLKMQDEINQKDSLFEWGNLDIDK